MKDISDCSTFPRRRANREKGCEKMLPGHARSRPSADDALFGVAVAPDVRLALGGLDDRQLLGRLGGGGSRSRLGVDEALGVLRPGGPAHDALLAELGLEGQGAVVLGGVQLERTLGLIELGLGGEEVVAQSQEGRALCLQLALGLLAIEQRGHHGRGDDGHGRDLLWTVFCLGAGLLWDGLRPSKAVATGDSNGHGQYGHQTNNLLGEIIHHFLLKGLWALLPFFFRFTPLTCT